MNFEPPALPSDDKRWKIVNGTMRRHGFAATRSLRLLHTVQSSFSVFWTMLRSGLSPSRSMFR